MGAGRERPRLSTREQRAPLLSDKAAPAHRQDSGLAGPLTRDRPTFAILCLAAPDVLAVPVCARLRRPHLRLVVDVHQAKALPVTERPLEVVHEAPGEVARDSGPLPARPLYRRDMLTQARDAIYDIHTHVLTPIRV